jgi:hypothetical protein
MAILYDWQKIVKVAQKKNSNIIELARKITFGLKPRNKLDIKNTTENLSGNSYLLAPELLLNNSWKYSNKEIVQYLALASLRNYNNYIFDGTITLDVFLCPVPVEKIANNRLLTVKQSKIHFLYEEMYIEEIKNGTKVR